MRSRLRVFVLVGLVVTAIDIGLLWLLRDRGLILADVVALTVAAGCSYVANRFWTFRDAPNARWVKQPGAFAATAVLAGLVDLVVLLLLDAAGAALLPAKVVAIALAVGVRWTAYRWILFLQVRAELAHRVDRPPAPGSHRLAVVVPAFEEAERIADTVQQLRAVLDPDGRPGELEIVVVDDGSTDDTAGAAEAAGARVVVQPRNRGKGAAVRAGMLAADARTVAFTDADLAYPPELLATLRDEVESGWDIVVGSRRHDETTTLVRARRIRELGGRVINFFTHLVLLGRFRDTQCGIKAMRSDVARSIFERTYIDGFGFDVEIFLLAEQDGFSLLEVPVSVRNRAGSSVRLVGDTVTLVRDLIRVRRLAGAGAYRRADVVPVSESAPES